MNYINFVNIRIVVCRVYFNFQYKLINKQFLYDDFSQRICQSYNQENFQSSRFKQTNINCTSKHKTDTNQQRYDIDIVVKFMEIYLHFLPCCLSYLVTIIYWSYINIFWKKKIKTIWNKPSYIRLIIKLKDCSFFKQKSASSNKNKMMHLKHHHIF